MEMQLCSLEYWENTGDSIHIGRWNDLITLYNHTKLTINVYGNKLKIITITKNACCHVVVFNEDQNAEDQAAGSEMEQLNHRVFIHLEAWILNAKQMSEWTEEEGNAEGKHWINQKINHENDWKCKHGSIFQKQEVKP